MHPYNERLISELLTNIDTIILHAKSLPRDKTSSIRKEALKELKALKKNISEHGPTDIEDDGTEVIWVEYDNAALDKLEEDLYHYTLRFETATNYSNPSTSSSDTKLFIETKAVLDGLKKDINSHEAMLLFRETIINFSLNDYIDTCSNNITQLAAIHDNKTLGDISNAVDRLKEYSEQEQIINRRVDLLKQQVDALQATYDAHWEKAKAALEVRAARTGVPALALEHVEQAVETPIIYSRNKPADTRSELARTIDLDAIDLGDLLLESGSEDSGSDSDDERDLIDGKAIGSQKKSKACCVM